MKRHLLQTIINDNFENHGNNSVTLCWHIILIQIIICMQFLVQSFYFSSLTWDYCFFLVAFHILIRPKSIDHIDLHFDFEIFIASIISMDFNLVLCLSGSVINSMKGIHKNKQTNQL